MIHISPYKEEIGVYVMAMSHGIVTPIILKLFYVLCNYKKKYQKFKKSSRYQNIIMYLLSFLLSLFKLRASLGRLCNLTRYRCELRGIASKRIDTFYNKLN